MDIMREQLFKPLQQQAYDHIRKQILDHQLTYNQIYSESKLALEMGISRTPVRDAVHRLYQEGLVDIVPNKGFILHKMTEQDVMEIYEVRSAIEGYCARKAASDHTSPSVVKLISQLQSSLEKQKEIFESGQGVEVFADEDQYYHKILVEYSKNSTFQNQFGRYMYQLKLLACYSLRQPDRMFDTLAEHQKICEAIMDGDPGRAYQSVMMHMEAPLNMNLKSVYEESE